MKKMSKILKWIFLISLLYYVFWIALGIKFAITGISSEYEPVHIESLCNGKHVMYYGMDGFLIAIGDGILLTMFRFWCVPVYQVVYIIGNFIKKIVVRRKR